MKSPIHWCRALPLAALVLAASACRKDVPTPDRSLDQGVLTALRPPVEFRVREAAAGQALGEGESLDLSPGANVITGSGGHAESTWSTFMALDMASGTDLLLSKVVSAAAEATMDQASGTVRYRLLGDGTSALVGIQAANLAMIQVRKAPADVIISLMPGPDPAVWVAVVKGTAELQRGADTLRVKGGQVAAFTATGATPPLMDLDREALSDWYDDFASGDDPRSSPTDYLFRCAISGTSVQLRQTPAGAAAAGRLEEDAVVRAAGRSAAGDWVYVVTDEGSEGWLAVADLGCNGPVANLAEAGGTATPAATASATGLPARPLAVLTSSPTPRRTPTVALLTPTASPTLIGPVINLSADKTDLAAGECTTLRWTVKGVRSYALNGVGKAGDEGSEKVCPKQDTTYKLTAVLPDGSEVSQDVRIKVRATATVVPTPAASTAPSSTTEATATSRPTAGPTLPPTAISLPTDTPAAEKPTDEPTSEPQSSATP